MVILSRIDGSRMLGDRRETNEPVFYRVLLVILCDHKQIKSISKNLSAFWLTTIVHLIVPKNSYF